MGYDRIETLIRRNRALIERAREQCAAVKEAEREAMKARCIAKRLLSESIGPSDRAIHCSAATD